MSRLEPEEIVELANSAFHGPLGVATVEVQVRHFLLGRMAPSVEAAHELGAASMEAPDGGRGMALAEWDELDQAEQEQIASAAAQLAGELCLLAAENLVTAARTVGLDESRIEPEVVALAALTPAIWALREARAKGSPS